MHDVVDRVLLDEVGVQAQTHLAHHGGLVDAVPHDVTDDQPHPLTVEGHDVVPVAADLDVRTGRQVAHRELEPGGYRQVGRQQAALQRIVVANAARSCASR